MIERLNEAEIRDQVTRVRKREHYIALGKLFKKIYIYKNVNDNEEMKRVINIKLQKEFIESRDNNKSM